MNFLAELFSRLSNHDHIKQDVGILIGDNIINLINHNFTNNTYLNLLQQFDYFEIIDAFRRIAKSTSITANTIFICKLFIDHVFLANNNLLLNESLYILQSGILNNFPVIVTLCIQPLPNINNN